MNEAQVRHDLIDPALRAAGWESLPAKVTVEQTISPGPVSQEDGQSHNPEFADYVLMYGNRRIAVVEAKASDKNYRAGEAQARKYAAALGVRFAYATNGSQVFCMDLTLGATSTVELDGFPTPAELMAVLDRETASPLEKICREIPWSFAGNRGIRYYQERALAEVILRNYVNDGVWTLSMKGFSDLLKQRYGSISEALSMLSFPTLDHALNYYSDIQHWLYAA